VVGEPSILAVSAQGGTWPYVVLFLCVIAGGAGVPAIGTAAVSAAAVLASQHQLAIDDVVAVACVAAVLGGVLGYWVGQRWGVRLMEHPGRHEQARRRALAEGHEAYERWGWLACFVIPSFIAGIARMAFAMFLIFNTIAAVTYQFATALPAYGAGKIVSGHADAESVVALAVGLGVVVVIGWWLLRRHRRQSRTDELPRAQAPHP
jgi:membrane protein DedA with SNARE-associated domain